MLALSAAGGAAATIRKMARTTSSDRFILMRVSFELLNVDAMDERQCKFYTTYEDQITLINVRVTYGGHI
jgi:hypothetical protein